MPVKLLVIANGQMINDKNVQETYMRGITVAELTMEHMMEVQEIKKLKELDDLTGLLEIMVFLDKFEKGNISNFVKDLRLNQQPVYRTIKKLTKLELIAMEVKGPERRGNFPSKYYTLTPKGKKLAKYMVHVFETYRKP